jgi:heterodisulfide reductase subunit A
MYAMKEAIIAKEHSKNPLVTSIFYMDIRNYGKDFVKYYNRAINSGVNFIRSRVHTLSPLSNGDIFLEYLNEFGELCNDTFDMVVLSVGMTPNSALPKLAEKLNFALNEEGFVKTLPFQPVTTSRPGIFSCGVINEPKDIPTTVMEASAAACAAAEAIQESRFTRTLSRVYPEERDTSSEIPRIGVFICHCGINIASIINVQDVVSYTRSLPFVELVSDNLFTCSADTQTKIKQAIIEHKLNRVVVASCSPRTHEAMFQETLAQAGLNKYLFEMANIRDQDSWVHQKEPLKATRKAKDLVRGAIAKAALLEPMYQTRMDLIREALVVGGGVSGLTAALAIAKMGYKTHLLEATKSLGGNAKNIFSRENDLPLFVENLINEVINHPLISIYFESTPLSSEGFVGNFETTVKTSDKNILIQHGVTVLTPGGKPHIPQSYLYGKHKQIILSLDLSELLQNKDKSLKNPGKTFVFIQCVESRDQNRPYCSKVCCFHALESALSILDLNPKATIYILYRDIQAYGLREKLYQEARARGVRFFRYTEDQEPQIKPKDNGDLEIIIEDHVLHRPLLINANLVILESGVDPVPLKKEIVEVFKAQLNSEGFLLEAHAKLRPVDLATSGQFIAGLCHSPKPLEESISQAKAAAARAIAILSKPYILVGGVVAKVDPEKCAVCCTCVRTCPVRVPKIIPNSENSSSHGHAFMEPAICQGCGICVSECPAKAIKLQFFSDEELVAKVTALAESSMI